MEEFLKSKTINHKENIDIFKYIKVKSSFSEDTIMEMKR